MNVGLRGGQDAIEDWIGQEGAHFVLDRGDAVSSIAEGVSIVFLLEEIPDRCVLQRLCDRSSELLVRENSKDVMHRRVGLF